MRTIPAVSPNHRRGSPSEASFTIAGIAGAHHAQGSDDLLDLYRRGIAPANVIVGHQQPPVIAAGDCSQNTTRRPEDTVGEQHPWRAGLSSHRALLCRVARKSGAVGCRAALVSLRPPHRHISKPDRARSRASAQRRSVVHRRRPSMRSAASKRHRQQEQNR